MKRLLVLALAFFSFTTLAAPKSELWSYWQKSNESNSTIVSHQTWQNLLDAYLVKEEEHALFQYAKVSDQDKSLLKAYITQLEDVDPLILNRAEQYAYWVNLYNAVTVDLILDAYPIKSITKLGGLFTFGPWGEDVVVVNGKDLTLNDIEHRILRPIWNDPRTHYAVNCASLGCPNLQRDAFTAQNTEMLLEDAAKQFINSDKGVLVHDSKVLLSSIYDWFSDDFGSTEQQLFEHLSRYRPELKNYSGKVTYDYDWNLNEKR
ncbi:DUF547 domain-containing protein [Vibrio sonorensis]|uniref:DUF547 domain-containing protein n=1 Tax=Vibrio sonorensis TaxID=1004316 RepID=UPI0008D92E69|nr:DUF547 domain-containing protein [Vibrio sonorensis]